jgi:hypothetical protein
MDNNITTMSQSVGEVIVTNTSEIIGQCHRGVPTFEYGSFIMAGKTAQCVGVVYNVETASVDPNRRATAIEVDEDNLDKVHPHLKAMLRNQFYALLIGTMKNGKFQYGLPPTPPGLHAQVVPCSDDDILELRKQPGFLRIIHDSGKSSSEELILNCCRHLLYSFERNEKALSIGKALSDIYRDDYDALRRIINRLESWQNT